MNILKNNARNNERIRLSKNKISVSLCFFFTLFYLSNEKHSNMHTVGEGHIASGPKNLVNEIFSEIFNGI